MHITQIEEIMIDTIKSEFATGIRLSENTFEKAKQFILGNVGWHFVMDKSLDDLSCIVEGNGINFHYKFDDEYEISKEDRGLVAKKYIVNNQL